MWLFCVEKIFSELNGANSKIAGQGRRLAAQLDLHPHPALDEPRRLRQGHLYGTILIRAKINSSFSIVQHSNAKFNGPKSWQDAKAGD